MKNTSIPLHLTLNSPGTGPACCRARRFFSYNTFEIGPGGGVQDMKKVIIAAVIAAALLLFNIAVVTPDPVPIRARDTSGRPATLYPARHAGRVYRLNSTGRRVVIECRRNIFNSEDNIILYQFKI